MITKKIRKVEDLNGMRWAYNGENFGQTMKWKLL